MNAELERVARQALACLDLTRLNDDDTEADIERLCERAQGRFGSVAAVCVWPRLAALARRRLPASIAVAAVANFPQGEAKPERAQRDVGEIVQAGAQEVDVVLPWQALLDGDTGAVARVLAATRRASDGLRLKVILETGMLDTAQVSEASRIALGEGADFLKTSTGKVPVGATPEAARAMLQAIVSDARSATVGFKASGGVRSVADAALYLGLVTEHLGSDAGLPARFRIGASGLLDDIEAVLSGTAAAPDGGGY
ncbi:MAG TPA: deoxyribose-phosphate aldolase [Ideonella sp.]|uniref:deoxyribose-phosphate aldolase n=1 Tax=Ideonella sp. TaxID=1929293 RepID=UPI002E3423F2|nr:deoxyribose-phosphate aldolase [Ideonella sp.]HEX5686298.1 deoxyribose-phosphate aldolase [Ideonella sp.]